MPQCVLCLKMIGLAFDLRDEMRDLEEAEARLCRLNGVRPTFLETLSFAVCPANYLFGPVMTMRKYKNFMMLNQVRSS